MPRRANPRRWFGAAIVVAVALLLSWWASTHEAERIQIIRERIDRLCIAIRAEESLLGLTPDPALSAEIVSRMKAILDAPDDTGGLRIDVISGDVQGLGRTLATHRVIVGRGDVDFLGLRVRYDDATDSADIVGYWDPGAT